MSETADQFGERDDSEREASADSGQLSGELDGVWIVHRSGGLLPPLVGVRKVIAGSRGRTTVGPLRAGFDVVGRELRYRGLLRGFVDVLEPTGDDWSGRATFAGRDYGRFRLVRTDDAPATTEKA